MSGNRSNNGSKKRFSGPRKPYPQPRIPEYDGKRALSNSQARKSTSLTVEYLAMLSGRNYLKKQYREQYWVSGGPPNQQKRPSTVGSGRPRTVMLYPDLGSVIGGATPTYIAGNSILRSTPSSSQQSSEGQADSVKTLQAHNKTAIAGDENEYCARKNDTATEETASNFTRTVKRSWSNIPTGKCYRVLSQPNETLASLCLEGRAPLVHKNCSRTNSTSSSTSLGSFMARYRTLSSTGDSSPTSSAEAMPTNRRDDRGIYKKTDSSHLKQSVTGSTEEDEYRKEIETSEVHGLSDAVFFEDENIRSCESDYEDEDDQEEVLEEQEKKLGPSRLSYSDLEESDISENEAEDYEEEENVDEGEVNRRLQQVSAVFVSRNEEGEVRDEDRNEILALTDGKAVDEDSSDCEVAWTEDGENLEPTVRNATPAEYQFAEVFPPPYSEYSIRELAMLPPDVNWRSFVEMLPFPKQTNREMLGKSKEYQTKRTENVKESRKSKEKFMKENKNLEDALDKLISMEKMQAITVQYERDRRRHLSHLQHRPKSRAVSAKSTPGGNPNSATPPSLSRPPSERALTRRSSTANLTSSPSHSPNGSKPRKSNSSSELRIDGVGEKSQKDLVRLSCTKHHLQHFRRPSMSRRRSRSAMPRLYEYCWSERQPESKRPSLMSMSYMKPRTCASCREKERRLTQLQITQMMLGRPRSSMSTFSVEQQKLIPRPCIAGNMSKAPCNPTHSRKNSIANDAPKESTPKQVTKNPTPINRTGIPATFGHAISNNAGSANRRESKEKINAARAILATVAREYARAGGASRPQHHRMVSSFPVSPQGSMCSPTRRRQNCQVLRPNVIDYTKLRLR